MAERASSESRRAELALGFLTVIWGSTFIIVAQALRDSSTLVFLALRFSLAAGALLLIFRGGEWKGRPLGLEIRAGVISGLLLWAGYFFQTWGLLYTTPAKSGFLTGLNVALVPLFGSLWYRRTPKLSEVIGIALAAIGMGAMTLEGQQWTSINRGDLLTLLCAVAFAWHLLALNRYSPLVSYRNLSLLQVSTAAVLSLATFWWVEPALFRPSAQLAAAVAITGLLGTAFAFSVMTWAQRHTSPTRAAVIFALEPVVALATSYITWGEGLKSQALWGAGLILLGILIVELKPFRVRKHPEEAPIAAPPASL